MRLESVVFSAVSSLFQDEKWKVTSASRPTHYIFCCPVFLQGIPNHFLFYGLITARKNGSKNRWRAGLWAEVVGFNCSKECVRLPSTVIKIYTCIYTLIYHHSSLQYGHGKSSVRWRHNIAHSGLAEFSMSHLNRFFKLPYRYLKSKCTCNSVYVKVDKFVDLLTHIQGFNRGVVILSKSGSTDWWMCVRQIENESAHPFTGGFTALIIHVKSIGAIDLSPYLMG